MEKENGVKTVVPALRFPKFRGMEGWKKCMLGNFLLEQPRYGINASAVPFQQGLPTYIRITDISEDGYFLPNPKVSVNHDTVGNFYLKTGDIVFARTGASVGKCYKYKEEDGNLVFAGFLIKVSPDQTRLSSNFLFQFAFTQQYWRWIDLISTRSGQPGINSKELATMILYLPIKDEQQKIADCLSSLDDLIEATNRKIEALKEHKKGLMQRLFPKEGENVPELRFPEFQGTKEWGEKQLGNVGEIITGGTPSTKDTTNYGGDKLFVSPADISSNRYISDTKIKLSNKGFSVGRYIQANSVLFVCIGSTIGKVAQNKVECTTNQQINAIVPYEEYLSDFIYSILEHEASKIAALAGKQAVPIINKTLFSSISILIPPKKDEQQKIADCLSSLDELIEATSRKVEILKEHKKGLMQQLFPKI